MYRWSSSGDGVNFSQLNVLFYALYVSLGYYSTLVALSPRTLLVVLCLHRKKSSKEKYNSVCTFKKALNVEEVQTLSFTTINSSGFFFLSNIKKKIMWSGDQKKNLGKVIICHFWPLFVTKKYFLCRTNSWTWLEYIRCTYENVNCIS